MVWYPSVDDIVCANEIVIDLGKDRHPPKLRGSRKGMQALIDDLRLEENNGLTHQAALLMKELSKLQYFDGGNHRTAYLLAKTFLFHNGKRLRINRFEDAYPFIKNVESRDIEEIRRWIEHGI
jgi:prophage maintenance system killer protein